MQAQLVHLSVLQSNVSRPVGAYIPPPKTPDPPTPEIEPSKPKPSPHPDGAVLAVADDQLPLRVEDDARHVVRVPRHGVHLPRLRLVHAPQLHLQDTDKADRQMDKGGSTSQEKRVYLPYSSYT